MEAGEGERTGWRQGGRGQDGGRGGGEDRIEAGGERTGWRQGGERTGWRHGGRRQDGGTGERTGWRQGERTGWRQGERAGSATLRGAGVGVVLGRMYNNVNVTHHCIKINFLCCLSLDLSLDPDVIRIEGLPEEPILLASCFFRQCHQAFPA